MTLLDIMEGRNRRNEGCDAVLKHQPDEWSKKYVREADCFIAGLEPGQTFSGEDMRQYISRRIPEPNHHNAWSAGARSALTRWRKQGRIAEWGWSTCKSASAHARKQTVYQIIQ